MAPAESRLSKDLAHALVPLRGRVSDDETLFDLVGPAPVVLIAESTHGTHEFYRARAEITKRLIVERGFTAVCIEGDWHGAYRVDQYVRGAGEDAGAIDALRDFREFPAWMWRNAEIVEFVAWLREHNEGAPTPGRPKTGFYGLDLYDSFASTNPYTGENPIWRDEHMLDTLERLMDHRTAQEGRTKVVVWAHNSFAALARRMLGDRAVSIGFTTYSGTVTAASEWNARQEGIRIVPARGDSYEYLFHSMNVARFLVPLRPHRPKLGGLPQQARERAIGVVYRPDSDLNEHYLTAKLIDQFDALYHFDVTSALAPMNV